MEECVECGGVCGGVCGGCVEDGSMRCGVEECVEDGRMGCGVRSAVRGVWSVVRGVWCVVCGVACRERPPHRTLTIVAISFYNIWSIIL